MRLPSGCPICIFEEVDDAIAAGEAIDPEELAHTPFPRVTVTDTVSVVTCENGHEFIYAIQDGAYALFFERGLRRFALGQFRDAILDAYTALEMYLSHAPVIAAFHANGGTKKPSELREQIGEGILGLTERCWGATAVAVFLRTGKSAPQPSSSITKIRNDAAHAGVYPSEQQAKKLIVYVATTIIDIANAIDPVATTTPGEVRYSQYWLRHAGEEHAEMARVRASQKTEALRQVGGGAGTLLAARWLHKLDETIEKYRRAGPQGWGIE
jgi:hypothetical protein